jgi:hypothetical protein
VGSGIDTSKKGDHMNENMKPTAEVLRELNVTYWAMNSAFRLGHVPRPKVRVGMSFVWTAEEIAAARAYFANRKGAGK